MRRLVYLLILVLVVGASATGVSASTDCERWFAAYRSELAHSQNLQRLAAAKRRARRYAQRKLAGYVKPKPTVHVPSGPRMTPHEALHKVELACGVLPESAVDQPLLAEETPSEFIPEQAPPDEVGLLPGFDGPGTLLPEENPVPPVYSEGPPPIPTGGAPIYSSPFTSPVGGGKTPPPYVPPVPEPSSIVLMLTGAAGAAGVVRRRFKA